MVISGGTAMASGIAIDVVSGSCSDPVEESWELGCGVGIRGGLFRRSGRVSGELDGVCMRICCAAVSSSEQSLEITSSGGLSFRFRPDS